MLKPYSGSGTYFNKDNTVDVNGGPKDGMIRTEKDMEWLQAMVAAGHLFYPKQAIGKAFCGMVIIFMQTLMVTAFMEAPMIITLQESRQRLNIPSVYKVMHPGKTSISQ